MTKQTAPPNDTNGSQPQQPSLAEVLQGMSMAEKYELLLGLQENAMMVRASIERDKLMAQMPQPKMETAQK